MDLCWNRWRGAEGACSWGLINTEDGPQRWCRVHDTSEAKPRPCLAARDR